MYCKKCGKEYSANSRFCGYCGAELSQGNDHKKRRIWMAVTIAGAILILLTILILVVISHFNNKPESVPASSRAPASVTAPVNGFLQEIEKALDAPNIVSGNAALDEAILKRMRYEVLDSEDATLRISVTAPNMRLVLEDGALFALENGLERAIVALEAGNYETITTVVDIELDENGAPLDPYSLYDAMYGGLFSVLSDILG